MENNIKPECSHQPVQNCTGSNLFENDEEFKIETYNGLSILYRVKDGYINVTKLCSDGGRDFRTFKRGDRFRKTIQYWKSSMTCAKMHMLPVYELNKGYNTSKGQYINRDLIHFVSDWVSIDYAFKVAKIMDAINEKSQLTNNPNYINNHLDQLQTENKQLKSELNNKDSHISKQNHVIYDRSVRTDNNEKILYMTYEKGHYKLRANSSKEFENYHMFVFPASMNIKQDVCDQFGLKYGNLPNTLYGSIVLYLISKNPKLMI
jgi:hypothetical protein